MNFGSCSFIGLVILCDSRCFLVTQLLVQRFASTSFRTQSIGGSSKHLQFNMYSNAGSTNHQHQSFAEVLVQSTAYIYVLAQALVRVFAFVRVSTQTSVCWKTTSCFWNIVVTPTITLLLTYFRQGGDVIREQFLEKTIRLLLNMIRHRFVSEDIAGKVTGGE